MPGLFGRLLVVAFGQFDCVDTWVGADSFWRRMGPTIGFTVSPTDRLNAGLSYERARGTMVMFGGEIVDGAGFLNDVFTWSGAAWVVGRKSGV